MTPTFPDIHDEKLMTKESSRKFLKSRQWQSLENIIEKKNPIYNIVLVSLGCC